MRALGPELPPISRVRIFRIPVKVDLHSRIATENLSRYPNYSIQDKISDDTRVPEEPSGSLQPAFSARTRKTMFSRRQISASSFTRVTKTERYYFVAVGLFCAVAFSISLGCCSRPVMRHDVSNNLPAGLLQPASQPVSFSTALLPEVGFSERTPIELPVTSEPVLGWPLNDELAPNEGRLQDLSLVHCQEIALTAASVANQIDKHREWLLRNGASSQTVVEAMTAQAKYERNLHVHRTLNLFFNLANIYCQQPGLQDANRILEDTKQAIEKLREAGVALKIDVGEFDRKKLELDEQAAILLRQQKQLEAGLQQLLQLDPSPLPIWTRITTHSTVSQEFGQDPESDLLTALSQRGDLRAIELLAADPASVTTEQLAALATGGTPLLSARLPLPKVASWWQLRMRRRIKQRIDVITQQETIRRREQLTDLAETKRRQIRKEIYDAADNLASSRKLLAIKQERLVSLRQSIEAAERAKDDVPLNAEEHVKKLLEATKLESEIVNQLFAIAIDISQLQQVRGDFAIESAPPVTCR